VPVKLVPAKAEPEPVKVESVAKERPVAEMKAPPREPEPEPEPLSAWDGDAPSSNRTAVWVAGVALAAVVGYLAFGRDDAPPPAERDAAEVDAPSAKAEVDTKRREGALASARDPKPDAIEAPPPVNAPPKVDAPPSHAEEAEPADDEPPETAPAPSKAAFEIKREGDPREVPPGTAPANAAAFRKLPVAPADRPPLGDIGLDGVHVDRIGMGSAVERSRCRGDSETFSLSRHELVNVCLRVVHAREKEDLVVLWQKDGGTVRRGKFVVPAVHAYRTRAYLVLRKEYVGKWTVRILDQKGTELASHPFVVVE
jgi:hypothetical protein